MTSATADLRDEVLRANRAIAAAGLATLTWGNVSGVDRDRGVYVIKPSGVPYDALAVGHLVVVALEDGRVVDGDLNPSVDSETHRRLYTAFPEIGGVAHTHSTFAVAFAQARRDVPILGTTHADTFNGPVRCAPDLTEAQCLQDYEFNTGQVIVDLFADVGDDPLEVPGALVASHGPFVWGLTASDALKHAVILEAVAEMALHTLALSDKVVPPQHLLDRHFTRKNGPGAYYGNSPRSGGPSR